MWQYLIEGPTWVYFGLGVVAILLVFAFFTTRRVLYLGLVPAVGLLALGFFLLDYFMESDKERVVRLTKEMIAAAERHDLEAFGKYISDSFQTNSVTKASLLAQAKPRLPGIKSLTARTFEVTPVTMGRVLKVSFMVDGTGVVDGYPLENQSFNLRLEYEKDDDGQWRIRRFEVCNAMGNSRYYPP